MLNTLLTQLDDYNPGILIIGVTSKLRELDVGLRRRFDKEVEFPVPSQVDREAIFRAFLPGDELSDDDIREVAGLSHGYVGADLV
jgi:AAA+ superfamily predicted ATPase